MKTRHGSELKQDHRLLNILAALASVTALAATIWIVVPAPFYNVWLLSVAASEWSFIPGALALFGITVAFVFGHGKVKAAAVFTGAVALLISLYPFISASTTAAKHDVSLSFRQYAAGFFARNDKTDRKTFTFATVGDQQLQLDVYSPPADIPRNGAGVVVIHGGSWNAGERSDFPEWNRWLAQNGYTVFDVDYRLSPQPNYLTATGDVKCAVLWVKRRAAMFGISPDRIALLGRSAGGHLALLAAYTANDSSIPATCLGSGTAEDPFYSNSLNPLPDESVRAVVSFYAPVDLIWSFDNPANERVINGKNTLAHFLGGSPHQSAELRERYLLASPGSHIKNNTPPTLLIHGGKDQLVRSENMKRLAEQLEQAETPHKTVALGYAQHGFDYNFNGWGAQVTQPVLLDFLRENIGFDK